MNGKGNKSVHNYAGQFNSSGRTGKVWFCTWLSGGPSVENIPDDSSHTARLLTSFSLALD